MDQERRARCLRAEVLVVAAGAALALAAGEARGQYTLVDLGTLGGEYCEATALNEANEVVGHSWTESGELHAFHWSSGVITDLAPDLRDTRANGINSFGEIVGSIEFDDAVLWRAGVMELLPDLGGGAQAMAINEWGDVAGSVSSAGCCSTGVALWTLGELRHLGTLGGSFGRATALNDDREIVGLATTGVTGPDRAFLWRDGSMSDLGGALGRRTEAHSISSVGDVVGYAHSELDGTPESFRWGRHDVGTLSALSENGSIAHGINDLSQIVGTATDSSLRNRAFLWQNGIMVDLNGLVSNLDSWELTQARAINNSGVILVNGHVDGSSFGRSALLIPESSACRAGNVNTQGGAPPVDIVFVNRDSGAETQRRVFVRAGEPVAITVLRAPVTRGPRAHWALWIYEGHSTNCAPVSFKARSGRILTLGEANACLPLENTISPRACIPPLASALGFGAEGVTSKSLGLVTAATLFLEPSSADRSPTEISATFPPGTFSIYSVHEDARSVTSPSVNLSVGNTIAVEAVE